MGAMSDGDGQSAVVASPAAVVLCATKVTARIGLKRSNQRLTVKNMVAPLQGGIKLI